MRSVYDFVETQRADRAWTQYFLSLTKNYDHVSGGQKSHYNEPALVEKTDEYDLLPVLWERKQRTWSLTVYA